MKKFTKSTLKSILKNKTCYIKVKRNFNGMVDAIESVNDEFEKVDKSKLDFSLPNTYGLDKLYLVSGSGNYFTIIDDNTVEIYNCCGTQILKYED